MKIYLNIEYRFNFLIMYLNWYRRVECYDSTYLLQLVSRVGDGVDPSDGGEIL